MSPMNNRLLIPRKVPGLLDLVPGAAAAYSLRSLSNSYADPVVTVRRSSDDAEEDFTASEVADGTLAAFCGAVDGFVKQWWDQSGNANHASQSTSGSQPQIVESGVVILEEGKPAIEFDGTNTFFSAQQVISGTQSHSTFFVARAITAKSFNAVVDMNGDSGTSGQLVRYNLESSSLAIRVSGSIVFVADTLAQGLYSIVFPNGGSSTSDFDARQNGATLNVQSDSATTMNVKVGVAMLIGKHGDNSTIFDGVIQELIIYPSDLTAQREVVEGIVAWGYSV